MRFARAHADIPIQCNLLVPMRTYQSHTGASSIAWSQVRYFRNATKGAIIRLARATSLPTNGTVAKITAIATGITEAVLIVFSRWTVRGNRANAAAVSIFPNGFAVEPVPFETGRAVIGIATWATRLCAEQTVSAITAL